MTKTHYTSKDSLVQVIITNEDNRSPRHEALMAVIKLQPQDHTRCRSQWGGVTFMLRFEELRAIAEAIQICDPGFHFHMSKNAKNKPEWRRREWQKRNLRRIAGKSA